MKKILKSSPWTRVLTYFLILAIATRVAGMFPFLQDFWFFLALALVMSWLFLKAEGRKLIDIQLIPQEKQHWLQIPFGTLAGSGLAGLTFFITLAMTGDQWHSTILPERGYIAILFLNCLWSSIVQEIVFRGYPFQQLLDNYGPKVAQWVTAIPFSLMHINSGMNSYQVALTILTTAMGSMLFGIAFIKTRHLATPIGLHLGWNFVQALLPRTSGNETPALVSITGNVENYTFLNVVVPYLVVMLAAIGFFVFWKAGSTINLRKT